MGKECYKKTPITSFGIILFYVDSDNVIRYLLAQRRDSIEYAEIIRGRYTQETLINYLNLMTQVERNRLLTFTFDELWDDLWADHTNRFYTDMKPKAEQKYNEYKAFIVDYINNNNDRYVDEPRWGFPKGKKNAKETDIQCAYREFSEETNMNINYFNLLNLPPSKEIFRGSNGKMYSTVYYIAIVDREIPIHKIKSDGHIRDETVSEEISELKWMTLEEALVVLPVWRKKLLINTDKKIKSLTF